MCGITGFVTAQAMERTALESANTLLAHRGPDDEGFAWFGSAGVRCTQRGRARDEQGRQELGSASSQSHQDWFLGLGHRRLAIVDLSPAGHQPMSYKGRYWISYNGEVYNHVELRRELEAAGHRFVSQSDTEVILAAYDQWGADCLQRFNGMWAFALYDAQRGTLLLARDRFGVKPLYYWIAPSGMLAFASEIKAFTVLPGWRARVNRQRAHDFLAWAQIDHTDETLFEGVFQIQGGCHVQLDVSPAGRAQLASRASQRLPGIGRWYELKGKTFSGDLVEAADEFQRHLSDSVNLRLRADVPVGSCLSGGLDSSAIVCLVNRSLRACGAADRQKTFSAGASVPRFDERHFMEEVIRATGVDAHFVVPEMDNLFPQLDAITWHQDEPFGSTSIYAQWSVFQLAARNGVKVMLDGQGADELLGGYHGFFGARLAGLARQARFIALGQEAAAVRRAHGYSWLRQARSMAGQLFPSAIIKLGRLRGGAKHTARWLDIPRLGIEPRDPVADYGGRGASVHDMSRGQLLAASLPQLLHWEDRDSMAHSVEARVPFLDYRLVEFALGLPDEFKVHRGVTKRVMREGMKGILPEPIRTRRDKLGFATPEEVWVREQSPATFRAHLQQAIAASDGVLKPAALEIFDEVVAGRRPFDFFSWRLISYGAWIKRFGVSLN